ncbi:DUF6970 domain-containing protein [Hymenobacter jejuensis]|nr:hypothetical protein [Hymenobacter jejuensis]
MKRFLTFLLLTSTLMAFQCDDDNAKPCPGDAVERKIEELKAKPKQNPAAEVYEYTYKGQKVYLISSDCCDQYNLLYDQCMTTICAPSGGFSGAGDGRCADFYDKATDKRLVWRDNR